MDEIKKNRALDEQEEKFSFRDKNLINNYSNADKFNNNFSKAYNDNLKTNQQKQTNINNETINKDLGNRINESNEKVNISILTFYL